MEIVRFRGQHGNQFQKQMGEKALKVGDALRREHRAQELQANPPAGGVVVELTKGYSSGENLRKRSVFRVVNSGGSQ